MHAIYLPDTDFHLNNVFVSFLSIVRETALFNLVTVGNSQMLVSYINPQKDYPKTTPDLFAGYFLDQSNNLFCFN